MEMWSIGADGSVRDNYFYDGGGWQGFQLAPAGSASPSSGIAVLSRIPNSMELWWIGQDGSVQGAYWYQGANWQRYQLAPPNTASLTSGIAALSRVPNSMELWFIGQDGSVHDCYWYEGAAWQTFQLTPAGSASLTSGIAALSRVPNSMELWFVGQDGSVHDCYWYEGAAWQTFQLAPAGSAAPTTGIAALARVPNSMELWFAGQDGAVHDWYWYEGGAWQTFQLAPPGSAAPTSGFAALSRVAESMEVWFVGPDGAVHDGYWYEGANWQTFELAPPNSAAPTSGVAAVSRLPYSMELWVSAPGGASIVDEYWYQDPAPLPTLSSSNNTILVDACKNLQNLTVTLTVTQDLVTVGDTGFSLQLNTYPQTTSSAQGQTLNWLQYIIYVGFPANDLGWEIQYWSIGAKPYAPNQPWPPGYQPNPANSTPWLPALSNDFNVLSFGPAPSGRIPAGSVMTIQLVTNAAGQVTSTNFSVLTDPKGKPSTASFPFPSGAIFPIYGFQVDVVGPGGGSSCNFISGAGTLKYAVSSGTLSVQTTNTCGGPQPGTGETSNAVYGPVTPASGSTVSQTLGVVWQGVSVIPGSALDGYWGSDSSQHVNYISPDGHVHELYIHPGAGWVDNDLTALSKGSPAASTSALSAYWGSDNSQHVNFISLDGHVHELYIHSGAGWVDNDLTALSKGTPAAFGGALDSYWGGDNSQHVNFVSLDGHVHELYIAPGAAAWVDNDLTAASKGALAASGSALNAYWGSDSSQHVNFISADGHVHELYIHPGAAWVDNDLTAAAKGSPAASGGAMHGYWGSDSSQHVNFISADGHVHELYIAPGVAAWEDNDLTAASKGPVAAAGSPLTGYWGSDSSQHVNFISADGHVHELYIHPGASWTCNDLTAAAKGTPAAAPRSDSNGRSHTTARGSSLHGYWGSDSSQHVNFISADGRVHELYIHPGAATWADYDLSANT
jgi:uncharacterized protein (DUF2147 family)